MDTRIRYFEQNRDFFRIYCAELGNRLSHPLRQDAIADLYIEMSKVLERVLEEGIARGELRPRAHALGGVYDLRYDAGSHLAAPDGLVACAGGG